MTEMMVFRVPGRAATATAPFVRPGPAKVTLLAMRAAIVRGSTIWKVGGPARTQGQNGPDEEITT